MTRVFPLSVALLVVGLGARGARADAPLQEYVDPKYHFAFQYPSDWQLDTETHPGKSGEMRAAVRASKSEARAVASIGQVDKTLPKAELESLAQRQAVAQSLIALAVKQIYEQASQGMHATKMVVTKKQTLHSDDGIKFYISTLHVIGDESFVIAGTHLVPFEQPYMISFIMMSPVKMEAAQQSAVNQVFNSFRLVGAR